MIYKSGDIVLFKIKENTFIKELPVYIDTSIYLFDDSNRDLKNYLGFYFANYYDTRISNKVFVYYKDENTFFAPDGEFNIKVIAIDAKDLSIEAINQISNEYIYVVVILTGIYFNDIDFDYLKDAISFDIAVITRHNIHFIKKNAKIKIILREYWKVSVTFPKAIFHASDLSASSAKAFPNHPVIATKAEAIAGFDNPQAIKRSVQLRRGLANTFSTSTDFFTNFVISKLLSSCTLLFNPARSKTSCTTV